MITLTDYFAGYKDGGYTKEHVDNAQRLLAMVNALLLTAHDGGGVNLPTNPATNTLVSGEKNGGWRPQSCPIGAPNSAHKVGQAVDVYDPAGDLDTWCMDNLDKLENVGLYLEDPGSTRGWSHLSTRAPHSGNRVFFP